MKDRFFLLLGFWALVLVAAFAQTPAPEPTPSPTPSSQTPQRVITPTPEAQVEAEGQPLTPLTPGPSEPDTDTMIEADVQPIDQEAVEAAERLLPDDSSRKRWRLTPLFAAEVVYDDNIFLTNTDRISDVIWRPSAGVIYELGDFREHKENYLSFQWIGQPVIYTKNTEQNGFNQFVALALQYRFNKLVAKLNSTYSTVRGSSRDVNTITTSQTFWNALAFVYDYSDKTAFDLMFTQTHSATENFQTTSEYQARAGMNYQLFPKTRVGFQGVAGVLDSSDTPLQFLQQALVQVIYSGTGKLSFLFSGGVQALEFEGRDEVKISPVFSLGVSYQPFPSTSISLIGFRNVVASSAEAGQDYYATGFEVNISQGFFQKFVAALGFGYENDSYFETTADTPTDRVDNFVFIRPRLTYAFVDWFSVSVFYEFRQTESTDEINSFYNNRAGLEILTKF